VSVATDSDIDAFIAAAHAAADAAGAVVRPFFRSVALAADLKGDASPVTEADRGAEQAMRAALAARFPDHGILGEEFGLERPGSRLRWVLDPIDGTRAFITGRPVFGTLVALLDGERPVVGLIDQPVTGERWLGAAGRRTLATPAAAPARRWRWPNCRAPARRCSVTTCRAGGACRTRPAGHHTAATATRTDCWRSACST
jgi:fructose-1,6-bisphosphatase/inositol monophosphatase family enzyme